MKQLFLGDNLLKFNRINIVLRSLAQPTLFNAGLKIVRWTGLIMVLWCNLPSYLVLLVFEVSSHPLAHCILKSLLSLGIVTHTNTLS